MPRRPAQVILCGPFPEGGAIGGYARCNSLIAGSFLDEEFGIAKLALTVPGNGGPARRMAEDMKRVVTVLLREKAPILHLTAQYTTGTPREYAIFKLAKAHKRKFLLDIRAGWFFDWFYDPKAPVRRWMLTEMIRGADAITVEGRRYMPWLKENFNRDAVYFPNFVTERDGQLVPPAALCQPEPGQPVELVYAGRLAEQKGIEEALDACAILLQRGVAVRMNLAGNGDRSFTEPLQRQIERLPPGTVVQHGTLSHSGVLELFSRSHMLVFPTRWVGEGHANVVNEAMQAGLPLVTTRQGFLGDVVTPECGVVLDSVSPQTVADGVAALVADWPRLQAAGKAARERVYSQFSDRVALAGLGAVYRALLAT
ncbi:MAG: glycosyltransferase family 4 protein [Deltaproteobacteria bacterium]|nr:glycosyltransferase family 4 protein [Deltaproteobacteria bacterium]